MKKSMHKKILSLIIATLYFNVPFSHAKDIFNNASEDFVKLDSHLIIRGGESVLHSKTVNLGGNSLQILIDQNNNSEGYSGTLNITTGDFAANRIYSFLSVPKDQTISYRTTITAQGTTSLNSINLQAQNQHSKTSQSAVSQSFSLITNHLEIASSSQGISLSTGPEGSNPINNTQLSAYIEAEGVTITGKSQAIYVDGNGLPASETQGASLILTGKEITLSGGGSYGGTYADNIAVYATQGASITIHSESNLKIIAEEYIPSSDGAFCGNVALYAKSGEIQVNGENNSSIEMQGGLVAFGENTSVKVSNKSEATTNINGDLNALLSGIIEVKTTGKTLINSESIYTQHGTIEIDIGSEGYSSSQTYGVRGNLMVEYGDSEYGKSDISVSLSGVNNALTGTSQIVDDEHDSHSPLDYNHIYITLNELASWNVEALEEKNNYVSTLTLNEGILNLRYNEDGTAYKTVDVNRLSGNNGLILFNAVLSENVEENNHLEIQTAEKGTHRVHVDTASGAEPTKLEQDGYLIHILHDEGVEFVADNNQLEYGVYFKDYSVKSRLNENGETEWYLTFAPQPEPEPEPELTPTAEAVVAMAGMGAQNALYLNQLSDVRKRLGDVRSGIGDGVWVSVATQKDQIDGFSSISFEQEAYRFNLGFDRKNGNWLIGGNIKVVTANQETKNGTFLADGDAHSEGLGLYATWYNTSGYYADIVFSINQYHQDINARMLNGTNVNGDYNNLGVGISFEGGRKYLLGKDRSWFIEPQIQFSYYRLQGDNFSMSNEMTVEQDDFNSLTGRLGIAYGNVFRDALGNDIGQIYARLGINHEFLGEQTIKVNDIRFNDDLIGTRVYYGLGGEWMPTENLKVFAHVERENGSHYTKEFELSLGVKYLF